MHVDQQGNFVIQNYQQEKPFSSFLSGIAGKMGIPVWAFYVNRGQGIASFGISDKDHGIMEFNPANKSYQLVATKGFRTFLKLKHNGEEVVYEPFRSVGVNRLSEMSIAPHGFSIEETNDEYQLKIAVKYFVLPGEDYGALVRQVTIENLAAEKRVIEVLDGMPEVIPSGITNDAVKEVSQTLSAWCSVYNFENQMPFYRLKATADDSPEVRQLQAGHFYLAMAQGRVLQPIVDPEVVFGQDTSLDQPLGFMMQRLADYTGRQLLENRYPTAMAAEVFEVGPGQQQTISSLFGHVNSQAKLEKIKKQMLIEGILEEKEAESRRIHNYYLDHVFTHSSHQNFNFYCRLNFMDNVLRGGFPITLGTDQKPVIYHIFSRKHGDLERDYNFFQLEPNFYSQGNGNYRDVNQNRRCDNFINPEVGKHNIKVFADLIQNDGYNPLVIRGSRFKLTDPSQRELILQQVEPESQSQMAARCQESFTPGELALFLSDQQIQLKIDLEEFINLIIDKAESWTEVDFGEGFWVDHWTYNLDLIENYLAVYPERVQELLLEDGSYTFYDSYARVKSKEEKYLLTDLGPRQLDALVEDEEKRNLIRSRSEQQNLVRTQKGQGEVYYTTLLVKMLTLVVTKISSLDPYGTGIEMEANKPGWYDALNGLPGIFGSSTPEMMELKRLVNFLLDCLTNLKLDKVAQLQLPEEMYDLLNKVQAEISNSLTTQDHFAYWQAATSLRDQYRQEVFYGFTGQEKGISYAELVEFLKKVDAKLEIAFQQAYEADQKIYTTYYYYQPVSYVEREQVSPKGYPYIQVTEFAQVKLPPFLEGQVRAMKILDQEAALKLHQAVRASELFDQKLKMYRLNGDLSSMPDDIGRARAFSPGWLENGSIWLHMEYKYLLELLKSRLYPEFFTTMTDILVPYQDPKRYGRSILENSSFILSSVNADEKNHGRGYIARLSGSTAEFVQIWSVMAFGEQPFVERNGEVYFAPQPKIESGLFTTKEEEVTIQWDLDHKRRFSLPKDTFTCRFLGQTLLVYHNPERVNTYDDTTQIVKFSITTVGGEMIEVMGNELDPTLSNQLRQGGFLRIDIYLQSSN